MSGLLHRLAARALGAAPIVRPVVGWSAEAGLRATAQAPTLVPERGVEHMAAPRPTAGNAPVRAASDAVSFQSTMEPPPRGSATAAAAERDVPVAAESLPRPLPPDPAEASIAPLETPNALPPSATTRPGRGKVERRPLAPLDRAEAPRRSTPDAPPPLLPRRDRHPLPPLAIAAAVPQPAGAARPAIEETTEVHVTIGRIEVTAVHEAPPPRREPARRKPKSLEEHLASRQGRRA